MGVLCLARKDHYLIFVQGVSITQRHTHAHIHIGASSVMGIHWGPGISWGRNTKPCLNQQPRPSGDGSRVCETGRGERKRKGRAIQAAITRPKDVPLLFFQIFPEGSFCIWPYSPPFLAPYPFISSHLLFQEQFLEARIYLFSQCNLNFPSAGNKCFALGAEKDGGRRGGREGMAENRAHSVAGWRAESSCCGVDLTDAPR